MAREAAKEAGQRTLQLGGRQQKPLHPVQRLPEQTEERQRKAAEDISKRTLFKKVTYLHIETSICHKLLKFLSVPSLFAHIRMILSLYTEFRERCFSIL